MLFLLCDAVMIDDLFTFFLEVALSAFFSFWFVQP